MDFGQSRVTDELLARIARLTGAPPHRLLSRRVIGAHRDLDRILDCHERGDPFYVYTGRGPSSAAMHLGHLLPFMFAKHLQDAFGARVVIQLTDDEKFFCRGLDLDAVEHFARENARDIVACGFDPDRTLIFRDLDYASAPFRRNIARVQRCLTLNSLRAAFGFVGEDCVGKVAFPATQAAPALSTSFPDFLPRGPIPCLVPCSHDQDVYFRVTRDVAPRLHHPKPALIICDVLPALQGVGAKMSSSDPDTAVFLTDSPADVARKISRAVTGGRQSREEQAARGADLFSDVPFRYLTAFLDDDAAYLDIASRYGRGDPTMLSGHVKAAATRVVTALLAAHQRRRAAVTDDVLARFGIR